MKKKILSLSLGLLICTPESQAQMPAMTNTFGATSLNIAKSVGTASLEVGKAIGKGVLKTLSSSSGRRQIFLAGAIGYTAYNYYSHKWNREAKELVMPKQLKGLSFDNIIGHDEAKSAFKDACDYFNEPKDKELIEGILLEGPPGTGKTSLARAFAAQVGVPFLQVTGSDLKSAIPYMSQKHLEELFNRAKKLVKEHGGCIIFIDEIETICTKRIDDQVDYIGYNALTNKFKTLLEGFDESTKDKIIFVGATNNPDIIDSAVLSRFQVRVTCDLPSQQDCIKILKLNFKDQKCTITDQEFDDIGALAENLSGRNLHHIAKEARRKARNNTELGITAKSLSKCINDKQAIREKELDQIEKGVKLFGMNPNDPIIKAEIRKQLARKIQ